MSMMTRDLYNISKTLADFRKKNYTVTSEDMEYIKEIRDELTTIAGPEDIMAVKIIKEEMKKQGFGVHIRDDIKQCEPTDYDLVSDVRSAIIKEMTEEMDAKILKYLDEHNSK